MIIGSKKRTAGKPPSVLIGLARVPFPLVNDNRAIAAELGVGEAMVRRAREATASSDAPENSAALCFCRTLLATTLPQEKVFQDVLPFPGSERLVADPACYRINAFQGTRLNFDDLVKRKTAFAAEKWNCVRIRHVTPTSLLSPGANHRVLIVLALRALRELNRRAHR
jgi:hypothetical protein